MSDDAETLKALARTDDLSGLTRLSVGRMKGVKSLEPLRASAALESFAVGSGRVPDLGPLTALPAGPRTNDRPS